MFLVPVLAVARASRVPRGLAGGGRSGCGLGGACLLEPSREGVAEKGRGICRDGEDILPTCSIPNLGYRKNGGTVFEIGRLKLSEAPEAFCKNSRKLSVLTCRNFLCILDSEMPGINPVRKEWGVENALRKEEKGRPEGLLTEKRGRQVATPGHARRLPRNMGDSLRCLAL